MNYSKIYADLISKYRNTEVSGYSELHHIIPKEFKGSDNSDNLVKLTARAHFIAHLLLSKMYPKSNQVYAAWRMTHDKVGRKVSNRTYAWLKTKLSKPRSEKGRLNIAKACNTEAHRLNLSLKMKGKKASYSSRIKMSESGKNAWKPKKLKISFVKLAIKITKSKKKYCANASSFKQGQIPWNKGKNFNNFHSEHVRANISSKLKGIKKTKEHAENIKLSWIKRKQKMQEAA
jgi:hypothetical protein